MVREGEYTKTIYTLVRTFDHFFFCFSSLMIHLLFQIKEERFNDAIKILINIPEASTNRAGLSLLGHCYYQCQDFIEAANCYEHLCGLYPENQDYKLYYAQSLFQAGLFEEAYKITTQIASEELRNKVLQLQSAICYGNEDYAAAQGLLAQRPAASEQTMNDEGCLLYQANMYDESLQRFNLALQTGGFHPLIAYNAALCHFKKKENSQALNYIGMSRKRR